ncbi:unnamed protein product [Parnassius apollo]|uniref:(apollo) hypothetical protein n=1 Tax=Parnassius apollo TaxID=110799 RepID=A0A8S3WH89_PARAO|nr:unnamed protein product [Parnassius apollo]
MLYNCHFRRFHESESKIMILYRYEGTNIKTKLYDFNRMNQSCFVCNIKGAISLRNAVKLFEENPPQTVLQSGKSLLEVLCEIVEKPIKEDNAYSKIICKKCYKMCTEYDSIQVRLKSIKANLLGQFKKTLPDHNLNYDTFNKEPTSKSILIPASSEKKPDGKKIVLPASKLQPLPPNFVIKSPKWPTITKPGPEIRILSPSTLNLKVTVGSSVLTQSIKTTGALSNKTLQKVVVPIPNQNPKPVDTNVSPMKSQTSQRTKNILDVVTSQTSAAVTSTVTSAQQSLTSIVTTKTNPVLSFNVNTLPKDFLSSAVLTRIGDCVSNDIEEIIKKGDGDGTKIENDLDTNDDQPMEIDEDCSLAVITATEDCNKLVFASASEQNEDDKSKLNNYFDVNLLSSLDSSTNDDPGSESPDKYVLGKFEILDERNEEDDEEEHTIVMDGENGSIIHVVSGQKFLYGDNEISIMVPEGSSLDGNDNGDNQDSNDEQIELQVAGDEETANAIIAAAQEQGGAFIKVESGEMFQVKSVESKTEEEQDDVSNDDLHMVVAQDKGQFKCLLCEKNQNKEGETFTGDATTTMQHLRSVHDARLHICAICGVVMRKKADYLSHLEKHSNKLQSDKSKAHECTICKKKYSSRQLLGEHMNAHSGSRPHACPACGKSFASKYTYQSHLKTHLDRPRPFKCDQCGKSFLTQQNLNQHEKIHSGVKDFVCNVCNKAFGTQHNLEVHGVVHSGNRPFVCGVCGKAFARRAEVRDHMRIHTGERPFACDVCGARFTQRSNLHSHRRATHLDDRRHRCQLCPKRFKRRRLLDYHVKASHTGERPLQCEVCQATFVYPEHFKKHMRIHSGEKPYLCEVCGKSFNSRDNRNTHRFVHSSKKPYECVVCGAGYMRKQLLYHHMNTSGHLAESIVVNQPRVSKIPENVVTTSTPVVLDSGNGYTEKFTDAIFEATEALQAQSTDKSIVSTSEADTAAKLFITDDKKIILQDVIITEEDYICEACFDVSMQSINAQIHGNNECHPSACSSRLGHTQVCPVCGRSLLNRQSDHIQKENPSSLTLRMINLIRATVAPRQISQYDRVCHACWLRFKRQALLTQQQDERRGLEGDETPHGQEEVEQPVDAVHVPELQPPPFLASTDERDSSVESVAAPEVHSLQSQTQQSSKSTINLMQDNEETPLLTIHNINDNIKDGSILEAVTTEQLVGETQEITSSKASGAAGMVRLVQVQLPDGRSGWLAVDS